MRPDISVAQWPNDVLELRFVQIGGGNYEPGPSVLGRLSRSIHFAFPRPSISAPAHGSSPNI
jgi:hypothetical protein